MEFQLLFCRKKVLASWEGAGSDANSGIVSGNHLICRQLPQSAIAKIAVDSKYWLWLNGETVGF